MTHAEIIADTRHGVDIDCYFGDIFVGCARIQLDQEPILIDVTDSLRAHIAEEPDRLAQIVDQVIVRRAK